MRVQFKDSCFIEGTLFKRPDGQLISGQYYEKGVYDVPDGIKLPSSAKILKEGDDEKGPLPIPKASKALAMNPLHEHDLARATGENQDAVIKESETRRTEPVKRKRGRPKKYA